MIDASVAFKWIVPEEPDLAAARAIREGLSLGHLAIHAPDLLLLEFASAVRHSRQPLPRDPETLLHEFAEIRVAFTRSDEPLVAAAMAMSLKEGVSVYDALSCALADALDCPLITADDRLIRKLPRWRRCRPLRAFAPEPPRATRGGSA